MTRHGDRRPWRRTQPAAARQPASADRISFQVQTRGEFQAQFQARFMAQFQAQFRAQFQTQFTAQLMARQGGYR